MSEAWKRDLATLSRRDKCLGPRGQKAEELEQGGLLRHRPASDGSHGTPHPLCVELPSTQGSLLDFLPHGGLGNNRYRLFGFHGGLHGLDVLQLSDIGDLHADRAQCFVKMLPGWNVRAESDEALSVQMLQSQRLPAREGVSGWHDQNKALLPAGDGAQAGPCLRISDEPEISTAILDGLVDLLRLAVVNGDFDAGVGLTKLLKHGREIMQGNTDDAGDAKPALELSAGDAEASSEAVVAVQNVAADFEIDVPLGSEVEGFLIPIDQRNAEAFFHGSDLLAHRALGDAACFGGSGEISRVAEIAEDLESLDMHRQSLP